MSCVSESRMAPVSGSARLSTSVPRRPRLAFLMISTADSGWVGPLATRLYGGRSSSIDIAQIPSVRSEIRHPGLGIVRVHAALLGHDLEQRGVHVRRHGRGVAAYI